MILFCFLTIKYDKCFLIFADNLIFHLELVSCGLGASKNHVHSLMTDLNIPVQKITDVYEK